MRRAVHAEWTKLRTVAAPRRLLLGAVAATVALGAGVTSVVACDAPGCDGDPARLSLAGVHLGQALVALLGVLVIAGEYGTGLIRATLTAVPRRATALAAKAVTLAGAVAAAGACAVLGALLVGRLTLPGRGFTTAHGHPALTLADGPMLRAAVGTVLYLVLVALLGLGVGAAVRDIAGGIGVVLGLLYLLPLLARVVGDPGAQLLLQRAAPSSAGLAAQATTAPPALPLDPWAGLGVTAGWAAAALAAGALVLHTRDA